MGWLPIRKSDCEEFVAISVILVPASKSAVFAGLEMYKVKVIRTHQLPCEVMNATVPLELNAISMGAQWEGNVSRGGTVLLSHD
jgi:hypothetical protein